MNKGNDMAASNTLAAQSPTETSATSPSTTQPSPRKKPFIYTLLKIARAEHAAVFRSGTMYMNTLRFFKELENDEGELIGDPLEGVAFIGQPSRGTLELGGHVVDPRDLAGPILFHHEDILDLKAFCMYAVHSGEFDSVADENIQEFTEYLKIEADRIGLGSNKKVVVITDTPEFMARVRAAMQRERIRSAEGSLVTYFDISEFHGPVDRPGFYKTHDYSAQREWRFVARVPNDGTHTLESNGAYKLEIGSIEDISILTTVEEFNATIKFALRDDLEQGQGG